MCLQVGPQVANGTVAPVAAIVDATVTITNDRLVCLESKADKQFNQIHCALIVGGF